MYLTQEIHSYLLWRSSVDPDPQTLASRRFTATVSLLPAFMVGMFVFGWWAGVVVVISVGTALLTDVICHKFLYKDSTGWRDGTWMLTGLLLAMLMPPNVGWWVPVLGSLAAITIGKYWSAIDNMPLLQPTLVGLIVLFLAAYAGQSVSHKNFMTAMENGESRWPYLTRDLSRPRDMSDDGSKAVPQIVQQLLRDFTLGDVRKAKMSRRDYQDAHWTPGSPPAEAIYRQRPIDRVRAHPQLDASQPLPDPATDYDGTGKNDAMQMLLGYVPATIGGASAAALLLGVLLLIFTGAVHWALPFFALATLYGGLHFFAWLYGGSNNAPIIAENIGIHMLSGTTLLGIFYLAADPLTAPRSVWGKIYAGIAFGVIELFLRLFTPLTDGVIISVLIVQCSSMALDLYLAPPEEPSHTSATVGLTSSTLGRL